MQISKTIKEKWEFRKASDKLSKYLMKAFDHYHNGWLSAAIINASFDELLKFNETNNEINNMVYKPKIETINFKEIDDIFEINETEYSYDLVRRFFKSKKRIITLGIGYPLIIEYKPNWTIVIAPRVEY